MKKRRVMYGVAAALCVVLLVAMRSAVSWRPHKVAFVGTQRGDGIDKPHSRVVEGGRVLLVECRTKHGDVLLVWDTSIWQLKRQIPLFPTETVARPTDREVASYDVSSDGREMVTIKSLLPQRQTFQSASLGEVFSLNGSPTRTLKKARVNALDFLWGRGIIFTRFSSDGRQIGTASTQEIVFWNRRSGALSRQITLPAMRFGLTTSVSPDFKTAIQADLDFIRLWDIQGKPRLLAKEFPGWKSLFSPDGKRFICYAPQFTSPGFVLICVDVSTGQSLWMAPIDHRADDLVWSRDGSTVFASLDSRISAFAAQNGARLGSVSVANVAQILPSPSSNEVWCLDGNAQLWSQRVY